MTDGRARPRGKRSFPTPLAALAHFTGIGRRADAPPRSASTGRPSLGDDEPGEVDAVNGAFMLCRGEAVREVGLLDEGYWLYMEDLDWCRRFWDAGWKVFYEPPRSRSTSRAAPAATGGASARRSPSTAAWGGSTGGSRRPSTTRC